MLARKNIALLVVFLLLISIFACVIGLYIKGEKVSEIPTVVHRYPEDNYIEIVGRALEGAEFFGPPFFRFFVEVDPSERYEVEGFNRTVTLGGISWGPELRESPNWEADPFVRVFGREVDNKIIAYIVDVGINGPQEWRPYYWMNILTRPERRTLRVLVKYVEKSVWIHGALSENDLLWELVYENRERFQVPDRYLGMEAWAFGKYRGIGGLGFVVDNLFVEQDGIYLEIYPSPISRDEAIKIASEHTDTWVYHVEKDTLELISAELFSVQKEDNFYTTDNTKIVYENQPQIMTRHYDNFSWEEIRIWPVGNYDHPEIHIHGTIPSKVWVVEFNCEGWITHWVGSSPPWQKSSGFKAVLNAHTGEMMGRYYRLENLAIENLTINIDKKVYSPGGMQVVTIRNQSDEVIEFMGLRFDLVWEKWDGTTWQHYKSIIQEDVIGTLQPGEEGHVTEALRLYSGEEFALGKYRVGTAAKGLVSGKRYGPAYAEFEVQATS